ncbi:hypothetical protein B5F34_03870 [Mediterranea sp. An20]|uniref:glycosyltransferase n=1 Tax=Mediterranea sp. An20 TaxID=1965586 RepID=UPI000B36F316|nr:glycosyltransferase [Mediterranea sp. An20]OUP11235.1 hypothetical protein B5F34_03870 [Mediterranea sp. An20]
MKFIKKLLLWQGGECRKKSCHKAGGISDESNACRNPLISIIVASYNYASYIGQTLDSILSQTYANFEVIVVDDGSTDDSVAVISRYLTDGRVRLYTHPGGVNKGLCETVKLGIEQSKGEYVAFCESDDLWHPRYLEKKVEIIHTYRNVGIISNNVEPFGDEEAINDRIGYLRAINASLAVGGNKLDISRNKKKFFNYIPTFSAVMIRKDILAPLDYHSPTDAWIDFWLYRQILKNHQLFYTDEKLTFWRMHDSLNGMSGARDHVRKGDLFMALSDRLLGIRPSLSTRRNLRRLEKSAYWDENYYKEHYGHLLKGAGPLEHYYYLGWKEGCNPSSAFSNDAYLNYYMDLQGGKMNPLLHYERLGKKEKRKIFATHQCQEMPVTAEDIQKIAESGARNVLFISHELTLTGAPRALLNMIVVAKKAGINPVLVSLAAGPMEHEINELGIKLFVLPFMRTRLLFGDRQLEQFLSVFDSIVFNTLVTIPLVKNMSRIKAQKICWLHEGRVSYRQCASCWDLSEFFPFFDHVYSVGDYAASFAASYLPGNMQVEQLLYGIPDEVEDAGCQDTISEDGSDGKVRLLFPGTLSRRKGYKVFLKSLKYLSPKVRGQFTVYIAGAPADRRITRLIKLCPYSCLRYLGELNHDELLKLYPKVDVVLCPSLDDPMPIVCTEAMMFSKPVVVTDHTGTAALVKDGVSGYIVPSGSPRLLAKALKQVYVQRDRLSAMGKNARQIYEADFTMEIFQEQVKKIFGNGMSAS